MRTASRAVNPRSSLDEESSVVRQIAGMAFPGNGRWSAQVLRDLGALPCAAAVRFKLDHLIGTQHSS